MATAASRGTSVVSTVATTWATTSNAFDGAVGTNPATYATWVNAARSTAGSITISGYTFGLSGGFTVNSVTAAIRHFESSTTNIASLTAQLQDSAGTNIGTAVAVTRGTTAATTVVTLGTPTVAQVNGGLRVLITATRANNTTSSTLSLDYVDLTVTYTATPKIDTFTDDFSTQDTSKWTFRNSTVHDGVLDCPALTGNNYDAYSNGAVGTYDLTASQIVVNIAQMVDPTDQFIWYLSDSSQANTFSFYRYLDGNLYSCERAASVDSNTNPVTWDSVNHKYLRIRESGGTIFWETSPTGLGSWTVQRSKAPAINITSFFIWLMAVGGGTQTTNLLVDSVNVTPPPPPTNQPNQFFAMF